MPFPPAIFELARRPEFWSQFFFETEEGEFPELEGCRLEFPVGPDHALVLDLDPHLGYFGLGLKHPGSPEPTEVGWDDQAHWHPHVLRWEELDLICRCVALADPALPHPGLPLVLLHRFTPICVGDRLEVIHPLIVEAYRTVGAFSEAQITEMLYRWDHRQDRFVWRYTEPLGWYPTQEDEDRTLDQLYSLRHLGSPDFPFEAFIGGLPGLLDGPGSEAFPFEGFNALVQAARARLAAAADPKWLAGEAGAVARSIAAGGDLSALPVLADALQDAGSTDDVLLRHLRATEFPARGCWVVETLLGLPPGDVIARALGHSRRPDRTVYQFQMDIPTRFADGRPNPDYHLIPEALDQALRSTGLGSAVEIGVNSHAGAPLGVYDSVLVYADVNDDRDRGLAIIRDVLTRAGVPRDMEIRLAVPEVARYPLDPGTPA